MIYQIKSIGQRVDNFFMYICKQLCSKERTKLEMNILIKTRTIYNKLSYYSEKIRYYNGKVGIIGVPFDKGQVNR